MLAQELRKSRVDETITRQLVKSIRFLASPVRDAAIVSLLQNLDALYPVFSTVAIALRQLLDDVSEGVRTDLYKCLRERIADGSHVLLVPPHMAFAVRLLAYDPSEESERTLAAVYAAPGTSIIVKRDIVLAMVRLGARYWLSDLSKRFASLTQWERRAVVAASYLLGDEGKHWRERNRDRWSEVDREFMQWVAGKNNGKIWELPL